MGGPHDLDPNVHRQRVEEAIARLQGRFRDDVAAYDEVHDQILAMADTRASGIVAQFPERFAA